MEKKQRVPKGKYYWWIYLDNLNAHCSQDTTQDDYDRQSDIRYETGNYFNSFFEAVSVAKKIRAVLNGADVIEMPSEEEMKYLYPPQITNDEDAEFHEGMRVGVSNTIDWFKDKIVK